MLYKRKYLSLYDAVRVAAERLVWAEPQRYESTDAALESARLELLAALFEGVIRAEGVTCYPAIFPEYKAPSIEYDVWHPIDRNVWSCDRCEADDNTHRLDTILVRWNDNLIDYLDEIGEWAECMDHRIRIIKEDIDNAFPVVVEDTNTSSKENEVYKTGVVGRPTSKDLARLEMKRRASEGKLCDRLTEEMRELKDWLEQSHPGAPIPTVKALQNALRHDYHQLKASFKRAS